VPWKATPNKLLVLLPAIKVFDIARALPNGPTPSSFLPLPIDASIEARLHRSQSRAFLSEDGVPVPVEFFLASDPSAVIEHTKRVLFLEDDDIAHIYDGELHIHRLRREEGASAVRSIQTLEIELAAIMKGNFDHFMQK